MNDLRSVLSAMNSINSSIKSVLKQSTYSEYDDMSGLKINYNDPEQLLLLDELRSVMYKLEDVKHRVDYLSKQVAYTGVLFKNDSGRYELSNGFYYTCGYDIEFLLDKDDDYNMYESDAWVKTRVEHDGEDYYLFGYKEISMQGLKARARR